MINNTKMRIAKKYAYMIEEITAECDGMTWAYSKPGYYFERSGTHTENGYTQKELYKAIQTLKKCDCTECERELKRG